MVSSKDEIEMDGGVIRTRRTHRSGTDDDVEDTSNSKDGTRRGVYRGATSGDGTMDIKEMGDINEASRDARMDDAARWGGDGKGGDASCK